MSEPSAVDRIAALRASKEAREAKEAERKQAAELVVLELEEKYSIEGLRRGHDFEIIEEGLDVPIVVKRAIGVVFKKWQAEAASEQSTTDFILACLVHPKPEEFHTMAISFPAIRDRAAVAIASLYKVKIKGDQGKF